jgi:hypothetical protein
VENAGTFFTNIVLLEYTKFSSHSCTFLCSFTCWTICTSWIPAEVDISCYQASSSPAHRDDPSLHLWCSLFCRGWLCYMELVTSFSASFSLSM